MTNKKLFCSEAGPDIVLCWDRLSRMLDQRSGASDRKLGLGSMTTAPGGKAASEWRHSLTRAGPAQEGANDA